MSQRKRLGEILFDIGIITKEQLDEALQEQKATGNNKLGEVLVQKGFISEQQLIEALEFVLGIARVELTKTSIDSAAVKLIPSNISRQHKILPIACKNGRITLAMSDPLNYQAIDDVRIYTSMDVIPVIAAERELDLAIQQYYALTFDPKMEKILGEMKQSQLYTEKSAGNELISLEEDAPVIRMVNSLVNQAVQSRASDIHIEPQEHNVRVRFRIDGDLFEVLTLPQKSLSSIISRLKILGNLDISEKRLPQDGRTRMYVEGREIDFRMSTIPSILGEKIVLRILDRSNSLLKLEDLGFSEKNLVKVNSMIRRPHGMILVTGPTGSGKTTTMYSILSKLNAVNKNIITLEDPVEYSLEGINQVQINTKAGLNFSVGLRSILRQDPDIIMVGEMRDNETAELGVRASLTGHLLLSTLHTNSAVGTVARIVNMGIEKYLLSSSIVGVISQRLVRKLCYKCSTPYEIDLEIANRLEINIEKNKIFYKSSGCNMCRNTGYNGRLALHEVLVIGNHIRTAINTGVNSEDILEKEAISDGMITIREDGIIKALAGLTSVEEVMKAVYLGG